MPSTTITKVAGLALGAVACSVLLVTPSISRPAGALDSSLTLSVAPTGELGVQPMGSLLTAAPLRPGAPPARAAFVVRNQTGVPLRVAVRAKSQSGDLDDVVHVRLHSGTVPLFDGSLAELRRGSARFVLAPGVAWQLRLTADIAPGASARSQGRSDEVALELSSRAIGGGR